MVDGVNFNPFNGKVFSLDEISKLDTDKNGKVSNDELKANMSWLSGGPDADGDVSINDPSKASTSSELSPSGKKLYSTAKANGVKDTASSPDQIKEYLNQIQDEYIQQYMKDNPGMSSADKSSFVTYVKSQGTEFINQFVEKNSKAATFDTQSIAAELINKLDSAVETRNATQASVNEKLEGYKNSTETSFKALSEYTDKADDDYVTSNEYKEMKQQAVNYIMGTLVSGKDDSEFLKKFDVDYKNNGNYQEALKAVEDLKACSDPAKMQELITKAETALSNFLGKQNVDGTSKLNDAIVTKDQTEKDAKAAAQKAEYKEKLSSINDKLLENMSNEKVRSHGFFGRTKTSLVHTQEEVKDYQNTLNKILDKFLNEYKGDGKNIEAEYTAYAAKIDQQMQAANRELESSVKDSADSFKDLKDTVNNSGTYISASEKNQIVNKSVDFLISEMAQGKFDISLLAEIYPDYAKDANFVEAKALMEGFTSSITRGDDLKKAKELLSEMIQKIGVDKLKEGVNTNKDVSLTMTATQRESFTSSIYGYDNNESISTGRYRNRDDAMNDIQNQAKQKLESLRSQLKATYKRQLGADYNESKIDAYINEAIYSTINQFTDMRVDKNGKHYSTEDAGFVVSKSGSKSRGVFNVKQLVDAFLANLESISGNATNAKTQGKNPVSLNSVMGDSALSDEYQDKKTNKYRSMNEAKLGMKSKINIIAMQLKAKLKEQLGSEYNATKIEQMISQATLNCLDSINENKGWAAFFNGKYTFNTNTMANKFYDEFNKLYESAAGGTSKTGTTETK